MARGVLVIGESVRLVVGRSCLTLVDAGCLRAEGIARLTSAGASGKVSLRFSIPDFVLSVSEGSSHPRPGNVRLILGALALAIVIALAVRERAPAPTLASQAPPPVVSAPGDVNSSRGGVSYTAPKRSALDVPPAEMRDVVRDLRRVPADRRVMLAVAGIHHALTGAQRTPVHAAWEGNRWRLRYGHDLTDVGTLSEFADLAEARTLLASWASAVARTRSVGRPDPEPHPLSARVRPALDSLSAPAAIKALARIDEAWRKSPDVRLLPIAAEALAVLAVVAEDRADLADPLYARALATSAMSRAFGLPVNRRLDAMLTAALGYGANALDSARVLGEDDPVGLYLSRRDSALAQVAATNTEALIAFLALSREAARRDGSWTFALSRIGRWPRRSTTSFKTALSADAFDLERSIPARVPAAVFSELDDIEGSRGVASRALSGALRRLGRLEPPELPSGGSLGSADEIEKLESRISDVGSRFAGPFVDVGVIDAFYRGFYFSAIHGAAVFALERYSSAADAAEIAMRMKGDTPNGISAEFAGWLDHLVAAKRGKPNNQQLVHDIRSSRWLGQRQLAMTLEELRRGTNFAGQTWLLAIARQYGARLDARPAHVRALAQLAHTTTWDASAADMYYRVVAAREGTSNSELAPWIARFVRDTTGLLAMIDDMSVAHEQRVDAARLAALDSIVPSSYLRARFQELVAREPSDWDTRESYIRFLRAHKNFAEVERVSREWLTNWASDASVVNAFDRTSARVELSRALVDLSRLDDAWAAIQPALSTSMGSAFQQGVTVLVRLGKLDEARALAQQFIERYPDSGTAHVALADVLWRQGDDYAAARALHSGLRGIDSWTFRGDVARSFADAFGDLSPGRVPRAVDALTSAGVPPWQVGQLGIGLQQQNRPDLAYAVQSIASERTGAGGTYLPMQAYASLRAWKGDSAAVAWLRPQAARIPPDAVAMILYQDRHFAELWSLDARRLNTSFAWLLRAAAAASNPSIARRHGDELRAHFSQAGADAYHTMGRYVMGLAPEREVLAVATTPDRRCEVAYYMGVRALAEGRPYDAADWFMVVTAVGQWNEGESIWALQQLAAWSNGSRNLAGQLGRQVVR